MKKIGSLVFVIFLLWQGLFPHMGAITVFAQCSIPHFKTGDHVVTTQDGLRTFFQPGSSGAQNVPSGIHFVLGISQFEEGRWWFEVTATNGNTYWVPKTGDDSLESACTEYWVPPTSTPESGQGGGQTETVIGEECGVPMSGAATPQWGYDNEPAEAWVRVQVPTVRVRSTTDTTSLDNQVGYSSKNCYLPVMSTNEDGSWLEVFEIDRVGWMSGDSSLVTKGGDWSGVQLVANPTQIPENCVAVLAPLFQVGERGRNIVDGNGGVRVRETPGGTFSGKLPEGSVFTVTAGPEYVIYNDVCMAWYHQQPDDPNLPAGWVSQGDTSYFLEPVNAVG